MVLLITFCFEVIEEELLHLLQVFAEESYVIDSHFTSIYAHR